MAAYLWKHGLLRQPRFTAEQGHIAGRPGLIEVEVEGQGDEPLEVRISGTAITVLTGVLAV
jgi:predicted PhzF superfamily epimerase YddE/YHI9